MAYTLTFSISLGSTKTGLTLRAQLVDTAGDAVGSEISSTFVEIGSGEYMLTTAVIPDSHRGAIKFYESGVPATILAVAPINTEEAEAVTSILTDTGTTIPATLTAVEGKIDTIDTNVDAVLVDTNELQTDDLPALIAALNDITVADILTTQMTESYAADGEAPTLAQALFANQQFLQERFVAGTTLTVKKLDGSSVAMIFTLNDAVTPTSITRSA